MADEKLQLAIDDSEISSKENKSKKSKKWKKKSNRGAASALHNSFGENGQENLEVFDNGNGKSSEKERKSLKERIRKISIRKSSKTEKRSRAGLSKKTQEKTNKIEEELCEETKITEFCNEKYGDDKARTDERVDANYLEDEQYKIIGDEQSNPGMTDDLKINEYAREDKVENEPAEPESENYYESSCEIRKLEEVERRKSKDNFDAVIAELEFKELQLKEEVHAQGKICNNVDKTTEEATKTINSLEEEVEEDISRCSPVQIEEKKESETEALRDSSLPEISMCSNSCESRRANGETHDKQLQHDNHKEVLKGGLKNGLENKENEDKKTFRPIKEENSDTSQKITRKAVGKVVGRYRQVHLTKTYCQCCSLM